MVEAVKNEESSLGIRKDASDVIHVYYRNIDFSQQSLQALQDVVQTYAYNYTVPRPYISDCYMTKISRAGRPDMEINFLWPIFFTAITLVPATRFVINTQKDVALGLRYGVLFSHFIFWFIYHTLETMLHCLISTALVQLLPFAFKSFAYAFALQLLHCLSILSVTTILTRICSITIGGKISSRTQGLLLTYLFICGGPMINFDWLQYWYPNSILKYILTVDIVEDVYDWNVLLWYLIPISFAPIMLLLEASIYYLLTFKIARNNRLYKNNTLIDYALKLDNFSYRILSGINLTIRAGQIVFLAGPNGCGKSTLLNRLAFPKFVQNYHCVSNKIGWCPQGDLFYDNWSVRDNLAYWGLYHGLPAREVSKRVINTCIEFRLPQRQIAGTLSGGQRRKLSLAIAIIHKPDILFLDEPFNNIDDASCTFLCTKLVDLKTTGCAILTTSHKLYSCADELILLSEAGTILHQTTFPSINLTRVGVCGDPAKLEALRVSMPIQPHHVINRMHIYYVAPPPDGEESLVYKMRVLTSGTQIEMTHRKYNLEDYYFDAMLNVDATKRPSNTRRHVSMPCMEDKSIKNGKLWGVLNEATLSYGRVGWLKFIIVLVIVYYRILIFNFSFSDNLINHIAPTYRDRFLYDAPALKPMLENNSHFIQWPTLFDTKIPSAAYGGRIVGAFVTCGKVIAIAGLGWRDSSVAIQYLSQILNLYQTGIPSKIEFHAVPVASDMWRDRARFQYASAILIITLFLPMIPLFNSCMCRRFNFMRKQFGCSNFRFWSIKMAIDFLMLLPSLCLMIGEDFIMYAQFFLFLFSVLPMTYVLSTKPTIYYLCTILFSIGQLHVYVFDIKYFVIYDIILGIIFTPYAFNRAWAEYILTISRNAVRVEQVTYSFNSPMFLATSGAMIISCAIYLIIMFINVFHTTKENLGPVADGVNVVNIRPRVEFCTSLTHFFQQQTVYGLVGANGSGKSSFIKVLAKVLSPAVGNGAISSTGIMPSWIKLNSHNFSREIVYLPQEVDYIDEYLTVGDLITIAHNYCNYEPNHILISHLGLDKYVNIPFMYCSGGTKQKVAFVMMYYISGRLMLMDEPTSGLDVCSSKKMLNIIDYLTDVYKRTTLIVAHEGGDSWQIAQKFVRVGSSLDDVTTSVCLNV